jgi:LPS-assembly lipoprotein
MSRALFPFLAFAVMSAAGCGFQPLYGTAGLNGSPVGTDLAAIYVEPISERSGYELRNYLLDLLNARPRSDGARYRLKVVLSEETEGVAIRPNATITRYNYRLNAHYQLFPIGQTAPEKSGNARSLTAYNVALSPYATVTAERDAKDRAARDAAERIRTELAVYFRGRGRTAAN